MDLTLTHNLLLGLALVSIAIGTIPLVLTDIREHRLPNKITYPLAMFTLLCAALSSNFTAIRCGLVAIFAMLLLSMLSRGGLGMGDVKLSLSLGTASGMFGMGATLMTFAAAFLLGGIWAIWGIATKRYAKRSSIPFGPALLAGFWLSVISVML